MPRYSGPHEEQFREVDSPPPRGGLFWVLIAVLLLVAMLCGFIVVTSFSGPPAPGPIGVSRTPDPPL